MSKSVLSAPHLHDEAAAYEWVEARVWPEGRVCPHCGTVGHSGKLSGTSTRLGVYKCYDCRKPFTVKVGTIFEASHIPLHKWLQAMYLMASSKKGVSANQLHRTLGITLKSAWFLAHRIREAMAADGASGPLGGEGKVIEADETYIGMKEGARRGRGFNHKNAVVTLVERGGRARSVKVDKVTTANCRDVLVANADRKSRLMTDEGQWYTLTGREFATHETVNHHADEYVRGDAYTNTVEGYFSIFKRGMKGVYQHCSERHLHRYLAEFDFRYSNRIKLGVDDLERADRTLRGVVGKRLTYRTTHQAPSA